MKMGKFAYLLRRAIQYGRQHGLAALIKLIFNRLFLLDNLASVFLAQQMPVSQALKFIRAFSLPPNPPLVSVIIPNLNGLNSGLERLLDSIKAQSYPRIEIVCIDSSSTDGSLSILQKHGAKIKVIPKNEFRHDTARNLGADMAQGEYILFTVNDACFDDINWIETGIKTLLYFKATSYSTPQRFDSKAEPYARMLAFCLASSAGNSSKFVVYGGNPFSQLAFKLASPLLRASSVHVDDVNHLVKRDYFLRNKYRVPTCEDMDFGYRLLKNGNRFIYSSLSSVLHYHSYKNKKKYFSRVFVDLDVINTLLYNPYRYKKDYLVDAQVNAGAIVLDEIFKFRDFQKAKNDKVMILFEEQKTSSFFGIDADSSISNIIGRALYDRNLSRHLPLPIENHPDTKNVLFHELGLMAPMSQAHKSTDSFNDVKDRFLHYALSTNAVLTRLGYKSMAIDEYVDILILCFLNTFAAILRTSVSHVDDKTSINIAPLKSITWQ